MLTLWISVVVARLLHSGLSAEEADRYLKSKSGFHGLFLLRTGKKNTFTLSVRYWCVCVCGLSICLCMCGLSCLWGDLKTHLFVWHCISFSALAVFSCNALYKSTFYLLTVYLLLVSVCGCIAVWTWSSSCDSLSIVTAKQNQQNVWELWYQVCDAVMLQYVICTSTVSMCFSDVQ